jgi:hypothetical protein
LVVVNPADETATQVWPPGTQEILFATSAVTGAPAKALVATQAEEPESNDSTIPAETLTALEVTVLSTTAKHLRAAAQLTLPRFSFTVVVVFAGADVEGSVVGTGATCVDQWVPPSVVTNKPALEAVVLSKAMSVPAAQNLVVGHERLAI